MHGCIPSIQGGSHHLFLWDVSVPALPKQENWTLTSVLVSDLSQNKATMAVGIRSIWSFVVLQNEKMV